MSAPADSVPPRQAEPPRPQRPGDQDCCGSGCDRCVWIVYEEQLDAWEAQQRRRPPAEQAPT